MNRRHLARTALLALAGIVAAPSVNACGLTDCLYGRQPAYAVAPVMTPVVAAYPPIAGGFVAAPAYSAGYTPLLTPGIAPNSSVLPLAAPNWPSPSGAVALQRPAYGAVPLDNPSVYTGLPVNLGYRGLATTGNPFYGTGNIYPNNYSSVAPTPVTAYRPDLANQTIAPVAGYLAPEPQFTTPIRSGLARFFNSLLGTGYQSNYYPAQVTYYRPATTIDPVLGTTVTVQQPCTSTIQQLQRTPYTTFDALGSTIAPVAPMQALPSNDCNVNPNGSYGYGATSMPSNSSVSTIPSYVPNDSTYGSGVQQAGDLQPLAPPTLPSTSYSLPMTMSAPTNTSPLSTTPYSGLTPLTNTSPLTGVAPSSQQFAPENSLDRVPSSSDRTPLEAPALQSARPPMQLESQFEPYTPPSTQPLVDPNKAEPTESYYERSKYEIERDRRDLERLTTQADELRSRVLPIPAPTDFRNPFENPSRPVSEQTVSLPESSFPSTAPSFPSASSAEATRPAMQAPDLLPRLPQPTRPSTSWEQTSDRVPGTRLSVPVREASILGEADRLPAREPAATPTSRQNTQREWQSVDAQVESPRPVTPPAKTVWYSLKK